MKWFVHELTYRDSRSLRHAAGTTFNEESLKYRIFLFRKPDADRTYARDQNGHCKLNFGDSCGDDG